MTERIGLSAVFEVDAFNQGLQVYLRGNVQAEAATNRTASAINNAGAGMAAGFGAALGTVAVNAIGQFIDSARGAVSEAIGLASAFEQLEFGIRALGASQDLLAGSTESFEALFAANKSEAEGYLLLLQDLAIPSIFTTQQIAAGQQMLQVFGFLQEEAFEINKSLVNFATASNVSPAVIERIAYAIGQVRTEGRLLATETRQFANAGIPLIQILAESLGKTAGQIREDMKEGLLTADVVLPIIIDYFKNFDAVTGESAKTLRGLFSALTDIKEISIANFMRGLLEPVIPILQKVVAVFTDERVRAGATALGEVLGPRLAAAIQAGLDALGRFGAYLQAIPPQTLQFIAVFGASFAVLTAFAAALGIVAFAVTALINPFTLVVGAVAAFIAYYTSVATRVTQSTNAMTIVINDLTNTFGAGFGSAVNTAINVLSELEGYMASFISNIAEWGANVVSTFADGINAAIGLVVDAMAVLGEVMAYWLAPGSPPRILPNLDKWGKEAADVYLQGWQEADFGALNDLGSLIERALKMDFGDSRGGTPTFEWVAKAKNAVAQAIDQIRMFGQISAETLEQIRRTTGSTSDEVLGYLKRYETLAQTTNVLNDAQKRLNDTTEAYDKLLKPLQAQLDKASAARERAAGETEAKGLERLLNTRGVSDTRKAEAAARLQEISARTQISLLEEEKRGITDKIQTEVDAAQKAQDAAQKELDLFQQRLNLQNSYTSAIQQGAQAIERAAERAAKARDKELTPLEKQLKMLQLQQEEMSDLIKAAKARKILEDENSTAAQKMTAQLELQEIAVRRQLRDIEAAKLGGTLESIRQIAIVAADLEKPKKGDNKLDAVANSFKVLSDADPEGKLAKFRKSVDEFKLSYENMIKSVEDGAKRLNDSLPPFLRFLNEEGNKETPPLFKNLKVAFLGIGGALVVSRIGTVMKLLGGLVTKSNLVGIAVSLLATAWIGDWFNIRERTATAVDFIKRKLKELSESETFANIKKKVEELWKSFGGGGGEGQTQSATVQLDFSGVGAGIQKFFTDLPGNIQRWWSESAAPGIQTFFATLPERLLNFIASSWANTGNMIVGMLKGLLGAGTWLVQMLPEVISGGGQLIGGVLRWLIGTALPNFVKGLGWLVTEGIPQMMVFLNKMSTEIFNWAKDKALPALLSWTLDAVDQLLPAMTAFATAVWNFLTVDLWQAIKDGAAAAGEGLMLGFNDLLEHLPTEVRDWFVNIIDKAFTLIKGATEIVNNVTQFVADLFTTIGTAFDSAKNLIFDALKTVFTTLFGPTGDFVLGVIAEAKALGQSIIGGIVEGIKDIATDPIGAITERLDTAFSGVRDWLMAKSPSKRAYNDIGVPIAQGIDEGAGTLKLAELQKIIEQALKNALANMQNVSVQAVSSTAQQVAAVYVSLREQLFATNQLMLQDLVSFHVATQMAWTTWTMVLSEILSAFTFRLYEETVQFVLNIQTQYGILRSGVENTATQMSTNVQTTFDLLHTGVETRLTLLMQMIAKKLEEIIDFIKLNLVDKGEQLGEDFAAGIEKGILAKADDIARAAVKVVEEALTAGQETLDAHSPSRESDKRIGQPFGMGIARGMLKTIDPIMSSVSSLMESMLSSVGPQQSGVYRGDTSNVSNVRHYHLNVQSQQPSRGIAYDFGVMELMNA